MRPPRRLSDIAPSTAGPVKLGVFMDTDGWMILTCPVCGFEYTHVVDVEVRADDDRPEPIVVIHGDCEDGHAWTLTFRNFNGNTAVLPAAGVVEEPAFEMNEVESMFWQAWQALPASKVWALAPQVEVTAAGSNYRLDFGDVSAKYAVEIDGLAYHNGQQSFRSDRSRQRDLELDGWRVVRFAAIEVMDDAAACAEVTHRQFAMFENGR